MAKQIEQPNMLNLTIIAVVALVAIVSLVALVLNAGGQSRLTPAQASALPNGEENVVGNFYAAPGIPPNHIMTRNGCINIDTWEPC